MYEQNKIILDYFKERKLGILNNLKEIFYILLIKYSIIY